MLKANIYVTLKPGVLDPQGEAERTLCRSWIMQMWMRFASASTYRFACRVTTGKKPGDS